jgi:uncharacterized protein YkwD
VFRVVEGLRHHHFGTAAIALAALIAVIASAPGASAQVPGCGAAATTPATATPASDRTVLCLVNHGRAVHGIAALRLNGRLTMGARRYSRQMVADRYFGHNGPGNSSVVTRVRHTGYLLGARGWLLGEALAFGQGGASTPAALVAMLFASPPHRAILLNPAYRDMGIGIWRGAPMAGPTGSTMTLDLGARN